MTTDRILRFLQIRQQPTTLAFLDELVTAYTRRVPWESAFRIAKRATTPVTADCPRWPAEFWKDAQERGGGGTCFESNYAFFWLLQRLGFDGYLTEGALAAMDATRRVAILGAMGELDDPTEGHRSVAEMAVGLGIEIIATGTDLYGVAPTDDAMPENAGR